VLIEPERLDPNQGETDETEQCSGFHERLHPMTSALCARHDAEPSHDGAPLPCSPSNETTDPSSLFTHAPRDMDDAVERWLPKLRRMAAYWAFPEEPDDMLQEIWLELYRSWNAVLAATSPLAMALQIAKRRCIKCRRSRRRSLRWPFASLEDASAQGVADDDPERHVAVTEEARRVHQVISSLDDRQREAFLCRRFYDLTGEETAKVLGTTRGEAYKLEETARMKIESELKRWKLRHDRAAY
jgi:RNA polymerase sigma factor (sigma-70 family)